MVGEVPASLLGALRVTVFIDWALQQSVPPSATPRMRHAVSDPGSARIEAGRVYKGHRFNGTNQPKRLTHLEQNVLGRVYSPRPRVDSMPRRGVKVFLRRCATLTPLPGACWSGSRPTAKGWPLNLRLRDGRYNYRAISPTTLNTERQKRLDRGTYIEAVINATSG